MDCKWLKCGHKFDAALLERRRENACSPLIFHLSLHHADRPGSSGLPLERAGPSGVPSARPPSQLVHRRVWACKQLTALEVRPMAHWHIAIVAATLVAAVHRAGLLPQAMATHSHSPSDPALTTAGAGRQQPSAAHGQRRRFA
jgi:hypothetical protein